jgi:hypothetical protein
MQDEPEVAFQADANPFSDAAQAQDFFAGGAAERRRGRAQQKRAYDAYAFERLTESALRKCFDVNGDVR